MANVSATQDMGGGSLQKTCEHPSGVVDQHAPVLGRALIRGLLRGPTRPGPSWRAPCGATRAVRRRREEHGSHFLYHRAVRAVAEPVRLVWVRAEHRPRLGPGLQVFRCHDLPQHAHVGSRRDRLGRRRHLARRGDRACREVSTMSCRDFMNVSGSPNRAVERFLSLAPHTETRAPRRRRFGRFRARKRSFVPPFTLEPAMVLLVLYVKAELENIGSIKFPRTCSTAST